MYHTWPSRGSCVTCGRGILEWTLSAAMTSSFPPHAHAAAAGSGIRTLLLARTLQSASCASTAPLGLGSSACLSQRPTRVRPLARPRPLPSVWCAGGGARRLYQQEVLRTCAVQKPLDETPSVNRPMLARLLYQQLNFYTINPLPQVLMSC